MTWSEEFIKQLDRPSKSIEYILRFYDSSLDYLGTGRSFSTTSAIRLTNAEITIDNARVTPHRWSVNFGGFTVTLSGDLRRRRYTFFKGRVAELWMIRNGVAQRLTIGQVRNVSAYREIFTIEFSDILSMMSSRLTLSGSSSAFFYNTGFEATVQQNFNFSSDPKLYLNDVTKFEKQAFYSGIIHVFDSQHGVDMYYSFSSATVVNFPSGYLTITAVNVYPSESNHEHLQVGDKVRSCARLSGRQDYIFSRMLMSTGVQGTTGYFDVYPRSWSLGFAFESSMINRDDMDRFYEAFWRPSSYHNMNLIIEEPTNIRGILEYFLSTGMFPAFKQGQIVWRGAINPSRISANSFLIAARITDIDMYSIESHQYYSPSQSVYYLASKIKYYNGSTVATRSKLRRTGGFLPSSPEYIRDHSTIYAETNQSDMAEKDLERLYIWDCVPFEELVISVSEKFATLCAGDVIELTSNYIYGIHERENETYNRKRCFVLGVRWLPSQSKCILTLAVTKEDK